MSRSRFEQMDAVGRHPGVSVYTWGKGFPRYQERATLWDNIQRVFGSEAFDLVHVYKPHNHRAVARCPLPKSISYNEAWDQPTVLKEIVQHDIRLVVFHHQNDLQALALHPRLAPGRLLLHVPHAANPAIFATAAQPWAARPLPLLLAGVLRPGPYPLRVRYADLIRAGRLPGIIRPHPGYHTAGADHTQAQFLDYAQQLGQARLALVCSSKYQYTLAKYAEAAMAGCLLVGDVPAELDDTLGRYMVRLRPEMSDEEIITTITWWLTHDDQARAQAAAGQQYALAHMTMADYARDFVQAARTFLATPPLSAPVPSRWLGGQQVLAGARQWLHQRLG